MKMHFAASTTALALATFMGTAMADTVKISGASTVFNVVVQGAKATVAAVTARRHAGSWALRSPRGGNR